MGRLSVTACAAMLSLLMLCSAGSASSFTTYIEPAGDVYDVRIAEPGLSLEKVNFAATGQSERFTLRAESDVSNAEWVYQYFSVRTTGLSAQPRDVVLDFRISKSWMTENNADLKTASLSIFDEASMSWVRVRSVKFSEDAQYMHFRAEPPSLEGFFAVTAEPVPVQIDFVLHCDGDGSCEPGIGENGENCGDCMPQPAHAMCAPLSSSCLDDRLITCSGDGSSYSSQECANGCLSGRCLEYPAPTGMVVAASPVFIVVVVALVSVIAYMVFSLMNTRKRLSSAERLR